MHICKRNYTNWLRANSGTIANRHHKCLMADQFGKFIIFRSFYEKAVLLVSTIISVAASVQAQDTTYQWVSSDGNPDDITATLTLDTPSSAGGSTSDLVGFTFDGSPIGLGFENPNLSGPFTWNSSQITSMNLSFTGVEFPFFDDIAYQTNAISDTYYFLLSPVPLGVDSDTSGSWEAVPAPDAGSSMVMLGAAVAGLSGLRRFWR